MKTPLFPQPLLHSYEPITNWCWFVQSPIACCHTPKGYLVKFLHLSSMSFVEYFHMQPHKKEYLDADSLENSPFLYKKIVRFRSKFEVGCQEKVKKLEKVDTVHRHIAI
jgi:hypothetical protein